MRHRILIIDDDPRSVEQLLREIRSLNLDVSVAHNQSDGYALLAKHSFPLALVDIQLIDKRGDLSPNAEVGYATIRHLRAEYPAMRVIAISAHNEKSVIHDNALKAGAHDFWSKTPDTGEIVLGKISDGLTS